LFPNRKEKKTQSSPLDAGVAMVEETRLRSKALGGGSRRNGHGGLHREEAKWWAIELGRRRASPDLMAPAPYLCPSIASWRFVRAILAKKSLHFFEINPQSSRALV
jgi:hypothetical protein